MQELQKTRYSLANTVMSAVLLTVAFLCVFLSITVWVGTAFFVKDLQSALANSGFSATELEQMVQSGLSRPLPTDEQGHVNFLILGLDTLENRPGNQPLTDTILLASYNSSDAAVSLLSFPRDLWSEPLDIRINGLYAAALEQNKEPLSYIVPEIERMTGVPVHYTVIVTLNSVATLIDTLGGVEVAVQQGFIDTQFPRSDVDVTTETDPALLYETISFEPGKQLMNGDQALKFVRSRHAEGAEGSDLARAARQQLLITAVAEKLSSRNVLTNPELIGQLAKQYKEEFAPMLPPQVLVAIAKSVVLAEQPMQFRRTSIPIYPDDNQGVLIHPPERQFKGQWVYIIRDLAQFQNKVQQLLGYDV